MSVNRFAMWLDRAQWLVVGLLFLAGAVAWPTTVERVPVHWNLAGEVDRYGGRLEGLFAVPLISLVIIGFFAVLPRFDPFRARYAEFKLAYSTVRIGTLLVLAGVQVVILLWTRDIFVNVPLVVAALVGALMVLIGTVLGQVKRNWFFGIRTPWTISSEQSWTETHRAGRWVFVLMGLAIVQAGVFQTSLALWSAMAVCLAGVVGLVVYSYLIWRRTGGTTERSLTP